MAAKHFNSQQDDASEICDDKDAILPSSPMVSAPCITTPLDDPPEPSQKRWSFEVCANLFHAALRGDWKVTKRIIDKDKTILRANIIRGRQTVLHVAAGAGHVHIVKELLRMLDKEDLILKDQNGNTAFSCAVAAGTLPVAKMMLQMNPSLLEIRGGQGRTPLYFAVLFGRGEMALYLYPKLIKDIDQRERAEIFFTSITNELYVLALKVLHDYPEFAVASDMNGETAFHLLAGKPSAFAINNSGIWKSFIHPCTNKGNGKRTPGLQLLKCLLKEVLGKSDRTMTDIIRKPSHALFTAAKLGNFEFVAELVDCYPDFIWETDDCNRSLFHIAVMYHHANIFNLVHKFGLYKDIILSYKDNKEDNILHLAAKLAPPHQMNTLSAPALQMQRDLLLFKEVKKAVLPHYLEMKNSEGKTPTDIFIEDHKGLLENGEWRMKRMVHACFKHRWL